MVLELSRCLFFDEEVKLRRIVACNSSQSVYHTTSHGGDSVNVVEAIGVQGDAIRVEQ